MSSANNFSAPKVAVAAPEDQLRRTGWMVACHNTFRLKGEQRTYWRWAHPAGVTAEGEGRNDQEALSRAAALAMFRMDMAGPKAAFITKPVGHLDQASTGNARILADHLAAQGWSIAVHNDYVLDGQFRTFWHFTHKTGVFATGEGANSSEALVIATAQAASRMEMVEELSRLRAQAAAVDDALPGMRR